MPNHLRPIGTIERTVMLLPAHRTIEAPLTARALTPGYLFATSLFAVAFALRWVLEPHLPQGFPFLTFFPAVIIVAFVYGLFPGVLIAGLSIVASWFAFIPGTPAERLLPTLFFTTILAIDVGIIHVMHKALARVSQLHDRALMLADERELIVRELAHRINNLIANVSSLLGMAARGAPDVPSLVERVRSRLGALGNVSSIFQKGLGVRSSPLSEIITMATAPVTAKDQISIDAVIRSVEVSSADAASLSLIFHELATNAVKYGALADPLGHVEVAGRHEGDSFMMHWREIGRPSPLAGKAGAGTGFGSVLISRIATALGGSARSQRTPDGYETVLVVSASRVADLGTSASIEETTRRH
jgi:two-component sensor histidine kinase